MSFLTLYSKQRHGKRFLTTSLWAWTFSISMPTSLIGTRLARIAISSGLSTASISSLTDLTGAIFLNIARITSLTKLLSRSLPTDGIGRQSQIETVSTTTGPFSKSSLIRQTGVKSSRIGTSKNPWSFSLDSNSVSRWPNFRIHVFGTLWSKHVPNGLCRRRSASAEICRYSRNCWDILTLPL